MNEEDEPTVLADLNSELQAPSPRILPRVTTGDLLAQRYRLGRYIARRGPALTFEALDEKLSRPVLIHVLAPADPASLVVLDRARRAATATDSRFLRVLDALGPGESDPPVVVSEYAPGHSLQTVLAAGPLSPLEAAWVVRETADALAPMHEQGLFHQRINPDTVILTASGNVKIVGLLIEEALEHGGRTPVTWNEQEREDVRDLGRLLYVCLTCYWPIDPDRPQEPAWGFPPAPFGRADWISPDRIDPGIPQAVSSVCDQVLSMRPHGVAIVSAQGLVHALARFVGAADAAPELEERVRMPPPTVHAPGTRPTPGAPIRTTWDAAAPVPGASSTDSTLQWDPREQWRAEDLAARRAGDSLGVDDAPTVLSEPLPPAPPPRQPEAPGPEPDAPAHRPGSLADRMRRRRLLSALAGLVVLSLILGFGGWMLGHGHPAPAAKTTSPTSATPSVTTRTISGLKDFDPSADGGNDQENPDELHYATDGNPNTAWHTLTYLGNPKFGGLKPGVGIVVDLGKAVSVGAVQLTLQGEPTGVELLIPQGAGAAAAATAPMRTVKQWQAIAQNPAAGTSVTLAPAKPVTTRWLLVYLTTLPQVSAGKYRGGIVQIQVRS